MRLFKVFLVLDVVEEQKVHGRAWREHYTSNISEKRGKKQRRVCRGSQSLLHPVLSVALPLAL